MARMICGFVTGSQAVPEPEASAWLEEFDALDEAGAYSCCVMPVLTEAVKLK